MDFSRYNNNRHFLLDTLPLDGVYFSWYFPDVGGQGQQKSGQLCLVLVRPDRQTADRVFLRNPDKTRTADRIETNKIRIDRHLTENPDRIQTAVRHWTGFSGKSGQKRDTDSAVRRRLSQRTSNDVLFRRQISLILYQK